MNANLAREIVVMRQQQIIDEHFDEVIREIKRCAQIWGVRSCLFYRMQYQGHISHSFDGKRISRTYDIYDAEKVKLREMGYEVQERSTGWWIFRSNVTVVSW
jgi:hypothetical protein